MAVADHRPNRWAAHLPATQPRFARPPSRVEAVVHFYRDCKRDVDRLVNPCNGGRPWRADPLPERGSRRGAGRVSGVRRVRLRGGVQDPWVAGPGRGGHPADLLEGLAGGRDLRPSTSSSALGWPRSPAAQRSISTAARRAGGPSGSTTLRWRSYRTRMDTDLRCVGRARGDRRAATPRAGGHAAPAPRVVDAGARSAPGSACRSTRSSHGRSAPTDGWLPVSAIFEGWAPDRSSARTNRPSTYTATCWAGVAWPRLDGRSGPGATRSALFRGRGRIRGSRGDIRGLGNTAPRGSSADRGFGVSGLPLTQGRRPRDCRHGRRSGSRRGAGGTRRRRLCGRRPRVWRSYRRRVDPRARVRWRGDDRRTAGGEHSGIGDDRRATQPDVLPDDGTGCAYAPTARPMLRSGSRPRRHRSGRRHRRGRRGARLFAHRATPRRLHDSCRARARLHDPRPHRRQRCLISYDAPAARHSSNAFGSQ